MAKPMHDIIQENASVFSVMGEEVFATAKPTGTKTANCFGIYYDDGKGLDAFNIFAKVIDRDKQLLAELGNRIWKTGSMELTLSSIELDK